MSSSKILSIRVFVEATMIVALSTVLSLIKIYELPQGGSVTAGSMVPLLWFSLRRGFRAGLFACTIYGLVQLATGAYIVHPIQFLLDYPIAFGSLGLAGLFKKFPQLGVAVGMFGRFFSHFIAGIVFWSEYAGDMNPILYSALYNGGYMVIEFIVSSILIFAIIKRKLLDIYI